MTDFCVYPASELRVREAAPELLEALQELSAIHAHAWETAEGARLMLPSSAERFEAAQERAWAAIRRVRGEDLSRAMDLRGERR